MIIDQNIDLFFKIYPNGILVNIIRDPRSWIISAKKHLNPYDDTLTSLKLWKKNCQNSFKYKNKYFEKIILIKFDDLIKNTEMTMRKICLAADINFEKTLLLPTFNGELINSDSSFKSVTGKIDKSVLETNIKKSVLSSSDINVIKKYEIWYHNFIKKIK